MNQAFIFISIFLLASIRDDDNLEVAREMKLDFSVDKVGVFSNRVQMFYSMLDADFNPVDCENNVSLNFQEEILPMDVYHVYENGGEEEYYSLLTKTVYGLPRDVTYFTEERLADVNYLSEVMPSNKVKQVDDHYELKVGFGAPDITFKLDFYTDEALMNQFPELISYFKKNDMYDASPIITAIQHNYKYSKIMGQKTSKMSISISRYFDEGKNGTLVINYTLNYIHNLPPGIIGGADMLVEQMDKGMQALVRDTRSVCR